jgi:hypothetical protein
MDKTVRGTIEAMLPADGPGFGVRLPGGVRFGVSEVNAHQDNAPVNFQFPMMIRERDLVIPC